MRLKVQCDVTGAIEEIDSCTSAANTPAEPYSEPREGMTLDGTVTFSGPYGSGSTAVEMSTYSISSQTCHQPPCAFELMQLDVDLSSLIAGSFEFIDPHLELATTSSGWINGTAVEIPAGALQFNIFTSVKLDGEYVFGTDRFQFVFSNTEPASGTLDASGVFTIDEAEFDIYGEKAVLNTQ